MTVCELRARLAQYPPDLEVRLADWSEAYLSPAPLTALAVGGHTEVDGLYDTDDPRWTSPRVLTYVRLDA